jgi:hypothetical protein
MFRRLTARPIRAQSGAPRGHRRPLARAGDRRGGPAEPGRPLKGGDTETDSGRGPPSRGRRSVWLVPVLPSGPALGIGPPIAMPHVRTLRGGGQESGHQHAPNDDQHDHEHSDHHEHAAYGTGDVLAGAPSTSAKASTTLWPHRSLGSTGRVGAGHSFAQRAKAADARRPSDARWHASVQFGARCRSSSRNASAAGR